VCVYVYVSVCLCVCVCVCLAKYMWAYVAYEAQTCLTAMQSRIGDLVYVKFVSDDFIVDMPYGYGGQHYVCVCV
jgi:hypothetical protein